MSHFKRVVRMGEVVLFRSDEHGGTSPIGEVVFIRDANLNEMVLHYKKFCTEKKDTNPCSMRFVSWMIAHQFCYQITCREIDIGAPGYIFDHKHSECIS